MTAPTQAIVLVGGLGSRLDTLTRTCPKPLLPVGGRPFLDTLLWHLKRFGFDRVLLSAGYLAPLVRDYAAEACGRFGLDVEVVVEDMPLGTGGALRKLLPAADRRFLLMNGDSLFDFNVLDLASLLSSRPDVSVAMALRRLDDAARFGAVDLDGDRVVRFRERGEASGGLVNGGVYVIERDGLAGLPERGSFEGLTLPSLAAQGRVGGRVYDGFFLDIGVPASYAAAETLVPANARRGAVFFDRDGVLNLDHGHVGTPDRFEWVDGAVEAVKLVNDAGLFAFLITNQAGVAKGFYGEDDVRALHAHVQRGLREGGAHLDDVRYCPHHPEGQVERYRAACSWRKPEPGMVLDLLRRWPVDGERSFVIGDKASDLEAGRAAGVDGRLFVGGDLRATVRDGLRQVGVPGS